MLFFRFIGSPISISLIASLITVSCYRGPSEHVSARSSTDNTKVFDKKKENNGEANPQEKLACEVDLSALTAREISGHDLNVSVDGQVMSLCAALKSTNTKVMIFQLIPDDCRSCKDAVRTVRSSLAKSRYRDHISLMAIVTDRNGKIIDPTFAAAMKSEFSDLRHGLDATFELWKQQAVNSASAQVTVPFAMNLDMASALIDDPEGDPANIVPEAEKLLLLTHPDAPTIEPEPVNTSKIDWDGSSFVGTNDLDVIPVE